MKVAIFWQSSFVGLTGQAVTLHRLFAYEESFQMASLEYINYIPHRPELSESGEVTWVRDVACKPIKNLPQIYWNDGSAWLEANLWAHHGATVGLRDLQTWHSNLRHLHKYADWLEAESLDWRYFPMLERDRVLVRWRKKLIELRDEYGLLAPSSATQRMAATIRFYKHARAFDLVAPQFPMWEEQQVVLRYNTREGFERTMAVNTTNLRIPNRPRPGLTLEDGLTPLANSQMNDVLTFASQEKAVSEELNLLLKLGFYSGGRIGTLSDLKEGTLDNAVTDSDTPGIIYLAVGPGYFPYVATKFDVQGRIMLPDWLYQELTQYRYCPRRLSRKAKAPIANQELLFLTSRGNRYSDGDSIQGSAVNRAMVDFRRKAVAAGLTFARHFRFHQSRATFGTWLTTMLLERGHSPKAVIQFVSNALLHNDIATTLKYIKFVEQTPIKIAVGNEYTEAFLGVCSRLQ